MATFLFDNDADMRVARRLVRRGHLVTSAREARLDRASDREVLLSAARVRLIVVTHNERDFVALHDAASTVHAGILALPHVPPEDVERLAAAIDALVESGQPLTGECYRLRTGGWQRRTEQREWICVS